MARKAALLLSVCAGLVLCLYVGVGAQEPTVLSGSATPGVVPHTPMFDNVQPAEVPLGAPGLSYQSLPARDTAYQLSRRHRHGWDILVGWGIVGESATQV